MAGKYIPPHMRAKAGSSTSSDSPTQAPERDPARGYSYDELANQFDCTAKLGTLNSASQDGKDGSSEAPLSFIIIFKDQHPEWPPMVFCKSNLHLLPSPSITDIDEKSQILPPNDDKIAAPTVQTGESSMRLSAKANEKNELAIPIFTQIRMRPPTFVYEGARSIKSITYIEPGSGELIRLLDLKFSPQQKERTPERWQESLSMKWAVIEMGELEEGKNPMVPLKKMKDEKSVTEMLQEMRVRDRKGPLEGKEGAVANGEKDGTAKR